MQHSIEAALSLGRLFGLESNELSRVERKESTGSENVLYLFRCEPLLPPGHRLAIDERRGIGGVYHEEAILKEIPLKRGESVLLVALALSLPYGVEHAQLHDLSTLVAMQTGEGADPGDEDTLHQLIPACNEKLSMLGLRIVHIATTYELRASR